MQLSEKKTETVGEQTFKLIVRSISWNKEHGLGAFDSNECKTALSQKKLLILFLLDTGKANTLSSLEMILRSSGSSLSITVSKLVDDGYIRKELPKRGDDGRKIYFVLTEQGKNILEQEYQKIIENINAYYSALNKEQQQYFRTGIDCLNKIYEVDESKEANHESI